MANNQFKKILIVDDEQDVVKILGFKLFINGYTVVATGRGDRVVELAHQEKPDLIILDIKMPDKDGFTVLEELKASPKIMSTPIILFSGLPPAQIQKQALPFGADGFVSKSADADEILLKIKEILDGLKIQPVKQK
jgi:DNA-binding response OmpR family regulator